MTDRLYLVQNNGRIKNVGRNFKSYDFGTVKQCADLFLGDEARRYDLLVPQLGQTGTYEWDCNKVVLYAPPTPAAHQTVLRLCVLGRVQELPGYCIVVAHPGEDLVAVFDNVPAVTDFLAGLSQDETDELFVRIIPLNKVVS